MKTEVERIIVEKLGVKLIAKEIPVLLARSTTTWPWRVTLVRKEGRGKDAKEVKMTLVGLFGQAPELSEVIDSLFEDVHGAEKTYWDFSQDCKGLPTASIEKMHKVCKKLAPRVRKFFGPMWEHILRAERGLAVVSTRPVKKRLKKSA
jgi:hypothetical protein